mgnify:FL=1
MTAFVVTYYALSLFHIFRIASHKGSKPIPTAKKLYKKTKENPILVFKYITSIIPFFILEILLKIKRWVMR